jgi:hypothetical protein
VYSYARSVFTRKGLALSLVDWYHRRKGGAASTLSLQWVSYREVGRTAESNTLRWKTSDTSVAGSTVDRVLLGGPTGDRLYLIKETAHVVNSVRSGVKPGSAAPSYNLRETESQI